MSLASAILRSKILSVATRDASNRRYISIRSLIGKFLTQSEYIPKLQENISCNSLNTMTTIQELQQENQRLKGVIHDLVNQLESRKKSGEIRVKPEQVFKSKEEQEAAAALEKLELAESEQVVSSKSTDEPKKANQKMPRQKKGGAAAKEPERPIDVSRLDLRIGKIIEVSRHPDADALYVEKIDCGDTSGPRTVISGLVKHVPIEEMQNRLVVVLCNLKPAKMRGILSEAMVMCASTPDKVELIQPPENAKPGQRLRFDGYEGEPDEQLNPKKKIWEQVSPDLKTNAEGIAMYKDRPFKVQGVEGVFKSNLSGVNIR